jgi:DNA topoisomerase VI subunit B
MNREVFTISRQLEFFSQTELTAQIGYQPDQWAIALLKELIDNALDACEMASGKPPVIGVEVEQDYFAVADNGPGLPESVLEASLDYSVRVSDKQNYVSPSRGQQGNALKTLWAAPLVLDGEKGSVSVITAAYGYRVDLTIDRIAQLPCHELVPIPDRQEEGTLFKIHSPKMSRQLEGSLSHRLMVGFALFNPHAHFLVNGESFQLAPVENFQKWWPDYPTSPHWYDVEALTKLASGLLAKMGRRSPATIREFVKQFDGLKRTSRQKEIGEAMKPAATLEDLANGNDMDNAKMCDLLALMKEKNTPIKAAKLGILGKNFIFNFLTAFNCQVPDRFYKKIVIDTPAAPCIIEVAIAGKVNPGQITFWGLNFTPIPKPLPWEISHYLQDDDVLIDDDDPIVLAIHITTPKFGFTDRAKATPSLPWDVKDGIREALVYVAKNWVKLKKNKRRSEQTTLKELNEATRAKNNKVTLKDASYQIMEQAYMAASDNNSLPANARQIMYQARPLILKLTNGEIWKKDSYFTQTLLPNYIRENPVTASSWDILYDSRGHFTEPHTGKTIELGTLGVRTYVGDWQKGIDGKLSFSSGEVAQLIPTSGSHNRYKFALFIEKEGFLHILESADLSRKNDIAIFSTKGMSNTAARQLVEALSKNDVTIFVAHDFDKSGLTIARTLGHDTRRYQFSEAPNVIDIGLRLPDIEEMELSSETVKLGNSDPREELKNCGCTQAEIDFLLTNTIKPYRGERVELNAMTSPQLINWLERKFREYGVTKFVPDEPILVEAYRLQVKRQKFKAFLEQNVEKPVKAEIERLENLEIAIPDKLAIAVQDQLKAKPLIPWDLAVDAVAAQFLEDHQKDLAG